MAIAGRLLPTRVRDVLLREPVGVDQVAVGLGLLERRQVLALQVLDQRELEALRRVAPRARRPAPSRARPRRAARSRRSPAMSS